MDLVQVVHDSVVSAAVAAALAVLLLVGGWQKLRDRAWFEATLDNYRLLPEPLLPVASVLLPLWELAAGALLLPAPTRAVAALLAAGLLLTVSAAVAINLLRGRRDFDCGCAGFSGAAAGDVGEQQLSWALVLRNAVLIGALIGALALSAGEVTARPLVWIDYLSVAGATLALLGLYLAANQLIANQPRLQALRFNRGMH